MHVQEYDWVPQQQQLKWTFCLLRNNIIKCKKCNSRSSLFSNNCSYLSVVVVEQQLIRGHYTDTRMSFEMKSLYYQSYEKGTTLGLLKKQNMICTMVLSQCCSYLKWYVKCDNLNGLLSTLLLDGH